jgi:hypothetical protein
VACGAARASDWATPLKRIPLNETGDIYLSLGGELRERYESYDEPSFGLRGIDHDDYLLHRLLLGFDLHAGESFRFYLQLGSHLEAGKEAPRGPTDVDELDVQQVYLDVSAPLDAGARVALRAGRQELSFGSARLVGVRDGPNVRRSFDGARITFGNGAAASVDAFFARPVELMEARSMMSPHKTRHSGASTAFSQFALCRWPRRPLLPRTRTRWCRLSAGRR